MWLLELMGFDRSSWRIDDAVHPFATGFGNHDVRITTRWDESFLPTSMYGAMHECGHGLYEEGMAQSLQRTPLGHAGVARLARVAEPPVGEHGGTRPPVLWRACAADRANVRRFHRRA